MLGKDYYKVMEFTISLDWLAWFSELSRAQQIGVAIATFYITMIPAIKYRMKGQSTIYDGDNKPPLSLICFIMWIFSPITLLVWLLTPSE